MVGAGHLSLCTDQWICPAELINRAVRVDDHRGRMAGIRPVQTMPTRGSRIQVGQENRGDGVRGQGSRPYQGRTQLSCANMVEVQGDLDGRDTSPDCSPQGRLAIAAGLPMYDGQV